MEAWLEQQKKEASGPVSIWKRAQQEREADAKMSPSSGPSTLHFDPEERVVPHYNRWTRAPPPPSLARPVAQPPHLPAATAGPTPATSGIRQHIDQACQTDESKHAEIVKELEVTISRKRTELEELNAALESRRVQRDVEEAALETRRAQLDEADEVLRRLLDDAREAGLAIREEIRKEHSEAKSSLTELLDHGLNIADSAFQSELADFKNELFLELQTVIEKHCDKCLAMFCTQEELTGEAEPDGEKRDSSSATKSAIARPAPCDRTTIRHSPSAGDVPSKASASEDGSVKPRSRPASSTAKENRKKLTVSSSSKTASNRRLTPAESTTGPKPGPSKPAAPGHKTVKIRPEPAIESQHPQNRPTRAETAAKQESLPPVRITTGSRAKSNAAVQPPKGSPMRPSPTSGPVKRPRGAASEAHLPLPRPRKRRANRRPGNRPYVDWAALYDAETALL
jgi:hypothetical protein